MLNHSNVIKLHEIIDDPADDRLYLVTDYFKNGSLLDEINHAYDMDTPLDIESIRSSFCDLIAALRYCHECA